MLGAQNIRNGHVVFSQKQNFSYKQKQKSSFVTLIDKNFDFLPRLFTITTSNGSYKFNTVLLKDSSKIISKQLESNPNNLEYHLDFNDNTDSMKKIEDIFRGLSVIFKLDEILPLLHIFKLLGFDNLPIYSFPTQIEIEIEKNSLLDFLSSKYRNTFTIKTNKKQYQCSELAVLSSKIIRDLKESNPEMNEYTYNFDDENDEFEDICKLFNFEKIQITVDNMNSLKHISEELKIEPIMNSISDYVDSYENSAQRIDDKKVIIETIDEIFDLLHKIQILTVASVKNSILHSIWVNTVESVQELAACILQTVRIGYKLQPYLIELIISLNECSNDMNKLNTLMPYLVNYFKFNFSKSSFYSSFYLKMAQKGIVEMDEALDNAMSIIKYTPKKYQTREYTNRDIINVLKWFLPELFERNINDNDFYNLQIDVKSANFFKIFFPSKIELYKTMRDTGIPIDDISKAIYNDDVDTLQSIISTHGIDINNQKVQPSIFDVFEFGSPISLINYSVMNGSIKCFKYLLLSHAELDKLTFVLSIYGGNIEIIRLVDQNEHPIYNLNFLNHHQMRRRGRNIDEIQFFNFSLFEFNSSYYNYYNYNDKYLANIVAPTIMNHQNDLFDWIFENKSEEIEKIPLYDIAFIAVLNGNAHALICCIDKGLDINTNNNDFFDSILTVACHEGFYRILQLIVSLCNDDFRFNVNEVNHVFHSGNASIFELVKQKLKICLNNIQHLLKPIKQNYNKLVMAIFNEKSLSSALTTYSFTSIFNIVIKNKNLTLFNFLKEKFTFERIANSYFNNNDFDIFCLLNKSCRVGFIEAVKELTEFILSKNQSADFTSPFYYSICSKQKEVYNYLLEKDVKISISKSDPKLYAITQIESDVCNKLLDKIDSNLKEDVLNELFNLALLNGNKNLVELLINKNRVNHLSLINAVKGSNIDIVNMILNIKSDSAFINMVYKNETSLNIAVKKNNIEIVKRLLSMPQINTIFYDSNDCTPLMTAISNFNIEMIDLFVQFYGDQISSQIWQINKSIQNILSLLSKDDENLNKKPKRNHDYDDDYDYEYNNEDKNLVLVNLFDAKSKLMLNKEGMFKTISKLAEFENVDFNCHFSKYTLLSYACEVNELELFDFLLKSNKVNVNTYSPLTGNTPLMSAILSNNTQIAQILIDNDQTDINYRNLMDQTALTIASAKLNESVIQSLINNEKFDIEISGLYEAYFRSTKRISELLLKVKNFDVNINMKIQDYIKLYDDVKKIDGFDHRDPFYTFLQNNNFSSFLKIPFITPLIKAVLDLQEEMIDEIVSHPLFNKDKSRYIDAFFASVYMNDIDIFRKLITLFGDDVNLIGNDGNSLLYYSVFIRATDITTEILNSNSFDSERSQIVSTFLKAGLFVTTRMNGNTEIGKFVKDGMMTPRFGEPRILLPSKPFNLDNGHQLLITNIALTDQMNELCNYDVNHDNLIKFNEFLPSGKTYFTSLNSSLRNIDEVINILINHGADPNLPDLNGVYPIEYACNDFNNNSNSQQFVHSLIHANNIDLSIKSSGDQLGSVKGSTILHILAQQNNNTSAYMVFNELLDMQEVEDLINVENEDGDTPLLIVCRLWNFYEIMKLFSKDNLDYKHRNKKGEDALDVLKNSMNFYQKGQFAHRRGYRFGGNNIQFNLEPEEIKSDEKREYYQKVVDFF